MGVILVVAAADIVGGALLELPSVVSLVAQVAVEGIAFEIVAVLALEAAYLTGAEE